MFFLNGENKQSYFSGTLTFVAVVVAAAANTINKPDTSSSSFVPKNLTVNTNYGVVEGISLTVNISAAEPPTTVNAWLGVPFAEPPVGDLRFKYPRAKQPWKGVLEAKQKKRSCYHQQIEFYHIVDERMWLPDDEMGEDCLYLNIWVPERVPDEARPLPVMVWLFGGGFMTGSANLPLYDGKVLAGLNEVIVVSTQYRLGLFGFMYLGNELCPGNMGLMDQSMALRWVAENIQYFGGDQSRITIFGESSGAVSVGIHVISPLTQPYFHRAIMQSGSPTADWGTVSTKVALRRAKKMLVSVSFFEMVKEIIRDSSSFVDNNHNNNTKEKIDAEIAAARDAFESRDYKALFSYLMMAPVYPRNRSWDALWSSIELTVWSGAVGYGFVAVVDKYMIPNTPEILLKQGRFKRIPLLAGTNRDEGTYFNAYISTNREINLSANNPVFPNHELIRTLLEESVFTNFPVEPWTSPPIVYDSIYSKYVRLDAAQNDTVNAIQMGRAAGDFHFSCPTIKFCDYMSNIGSPVYFYFFNHCLDYRGRSAQAWPKWMGVLHGDEIMFIFGDPVFPKTRDYTEDEVRLSRAIMKYWTNFAKTGNPNSPSENTNNVPVEWPRYRYPSRKHIDLIAGNISKGCGLKVNDCFFWDYYIPQLLVALGRCERVRTSAAKAANQSRLVLRILLVFFNLVYIVF